MAEVQEICDRVGVINQGRLLRESTVSELRGGTTLRVRAEPLDTALAVAMAVAGDDSVSIEGESLILDLPPEEASRVNRELVLAGVEVHEMTAVERSLEDVFFEMTTEMTTEVAR